MARTITITTPVGKVPGKLTRQAPAKRNRPEVGILLAHGAGAGQEHPWMVSMTGRLARTGFTVLTFNYAYTAEGRKAPDRLPKLMDVHTAAATRFAKMVDVVLLAGKSMGGRVGGHIVAESGFDAAGIVYLGYPLVAMGKREPRDTAHLRTVAAPQLFISGTRDPLGPMDLVADVAGSVPNGTFVAIDDGDHSLVPRKATGRTVDDSLDTATAAITQWWSSNR